MKKKLLYIDLNSFKNVNVLTFMPIYITLNPLVDFAPRPLLNLMEIGPAKSTPHVKNGRSSVTLCLGRLPIN